jgi:nondiscriminating aspartyl-tRNA synthetase
MNRTLIKDLRTHKDTDDYLQINGWVHTIRDKGKIAFLEVKDRTSTVQVVIDNPAGEPLDIKRYDIVSFKGKSVASSVRSGIPRVEFLADKHNIISTPKSEYPLAITPNAQNSPDHEFNNRVLSVRNPKNNVLFRVQASIAKHFSDYLRSEGFTQIFSPKIVPQVAESGANMFKLVLFCEEIFRRSTTSNFSHKLLRTSRANQ